MNINKLFCFILAGGKGTRLESLTNEESKAMVKIDSSFPLIDFTLFNCTVAEIKNLGVVIQYAPESLIEYLIDWRNFINQNIKILPPKSNLEYDDVKIYDTAQSVLLNKDIVEKSECEDILITHCDHVYFTDYKKLYKKHLKSGADLTIGVFEVPIEEAHRFGVFNIDEYGNVIGFEEKPKNPSSNLISTGIYIYKKEILFDILNKFKNTKKDISFSKDIVPYFVNNLKVKTIKFNNYWKDIGTTESYWKLNMFALDNKKDFYEFLGYNNTSLLNKKVPLQPSIINSNIETSFIGFGNKIDGKVKHSVLGNNIIVENGAIIINSVISDLCTVKKGVKIINSVISKNTTIEEDFGNKDCISSI